MDKVKILYAEDEPYLGKIVKESLESRDFEVTMIADGAKVMATFEQHTPDICILDVMLPNKDGFSLGQEIRAIDTQIPILFLTAKNQTQDLVKGFASGGNDYIKKPFSMEELIVRINNLLSLSKVKQNSSSSGQSVNIGAFQFHPLKYELKIGDKIQKLSHREVQLLEALINRRNLTIERRHILKTIWGDDSFFNSRNLDVYIKKLRNYLSDDPNVQIITLKGVGYRFVVT